MPHLALGNSKLLSGEGLLAYRRYRGCRPRQGLRSVIRCNFSTVDIFFHCTELMRQASQPANS
jgi:hypothetical protein